jgi:hypothetical protein
MFFARNVSGCVHSVLIALLSPRSQTDVWISGDVAVNKKASIGTAIVDFLFGDRGPLPEVDEQDSETSWSLWDEAVEKLDGQARNWRAMHELAVARSRE